MMGFTLAQVLEQHQTDGRAYCEFLRVPTLSMGIYKLPAGGTDRQHPHNEDEVYFVLEGQARFQMGEEDIAVESGHLLFVPAGVPHRFHDVASDLALLVFFAPAESSGEAVVP
jgi:mannose-6-phosphate isomerase-like protein (cupin superfamily)